MDIAAGRLSAEALADNFADAHPPLDRHEATVAADRCYFCHDAPCITACPTEIDIPLFIRQIAAGQPEAAAVTILEQNILGGMCARVCPTETLCEEACVREAAEGKPVEIGALQRHATDALMAAGRHPFARAAPTGKRVAVVGAGPAGLACAHRLAMHGHDVIVYDAKPKPGGLNEYGIAAYKTVDGFAQAEIDWLLQIGGIEIRHGQALGRDLTLEGLRRDHDAVFLGIGLGGTNALDLPAEDAVAFIERLRQSPLADMPVGRRVAVVGGGMTAIDAAMQSKLLGAEEVTILYRRGRDRMGASGKEQERALKHGIRILERTQPTGLEGEILTVARTDVEARATDDTFALPVDQVLTAIGQTLTFEGLALEGRKIAIDAEGRSSDPHIWAGGDCAAGGDDLTVTAVAQGRDAAESIHRALIG